MPQTTRTSLDLNVAHPLGRNRYRIQRPHRTRNIGGSAVGARSHDLFELMEMHRLDGVPSWRLTTGMQTSEFSSGVAVGPNYAS